MPGEFPIKGSGSWSENKGQLLRAKVAEGLAEAEKVMLKDGVQAAAWKQTPVSMKMKLPGVDDTFTIEGLLLQQTDKTVIVSPKLGGLFYGVSIILANEVELTPM